MRKLADDVWQIGGFPPNGINVYVIGDVLIDAATKFGSRRILRGLGDHTLAAHALTHAHPDHQGASHALCTRLGLPLWCPAGDADAMEQGTVMDFQARHPVNRIIGALWCGPAHPVARRLREGDEVAGFTVLDVPGHSAGHVAYWREADRTLIAGDVLNSMNVRTARRGLHEPETIFTADVARNRESIRRIAGLEPALALFGHGPPWRDPAALRAFADRL